MRISRFHVITPDFESPDDVIEFALNILPHGVDWIQLRMKRVSETIVWRTAAMLRHVTHEYGASLIINDYPDVAVDVQADGVHLGLNDEPIDEVRSRIDADDFIIGASAHTLAEIKQQVRRGADYIGVGPLRPSSTKSNTRQPLGIEGYKQLTSTFKGAMPIIAIGGVTVADVSSLLLAGVTGVAVSSAVNVGDDAKPVIESFISELNNEQLYYI